jgi:5-methyltetrahydrofolate--homocysteine methyltransferase
MNRYTQLLQDRPWLLADGATGSNLFQVGLVSGEAPEIWNFEHPDRIRALHKSFVDAGADIILTNSFGGTRYRLKLHQLDSKVTEVNQRAAELARMEADAVARPVAVGGSMGPTGEILEPLGPLSLADAEQAFAEQAQALKAGGVDVLWIETMSSKEEVEAAIKGAQTTGLPIVTTMSFDTNGRTMMSLTPADLVEIKNAHGISACGSNCGVGPSEMVASIVNMANAAHANGAEAVLVAKGNCGIPRYAEGSIVYDGTPELMAQYATMALDAGARIIGGCCGTSPVHLKAMREALEQHTKGSKPDAATIEARLGALTMGARAQLDGLMDRASGAAAGANTRRPSRRRGE